MKIEGEIPPAFDDKYVVAMLEAVDVTLVEVPEVEVDEDAEAASAFEDIERGEGLAMVWGLALFTNILMVASLSPMSKTEGESG